MKKPVPECTDGRREFTFRSMVIGVLITVVFAAGNVYFGLKAGITFTTSIPAAVISMGILHAFKDATTQEYNIVQTVASASGTLASIIFVLPGLVIVGWWTGFPFWMSFLVCAAGGILGVMYTIPLRRALVTDSDLPYPEGVACAEVLKVGSGRAKNINIEASETVGASMEAVVVGALVSATFYMVVQTRIFASDLVHYFRIEKTPAATGADLNLSFALFAIGHLVGPTVGVAILVGALIAWGWAVPHYLLTHVVGGSATVAVQGAWDHYVRFVGAGMIAVTAVWTLGLLVKPIMKGLVGTLASSRIAKTWQAHLLPRTEQDIPISAVGLISLMCLVSVAWLLWHFNRFSGLREEAGILALGGVIFVALMGFLVSTVCGYMSGLIGSSNSPLSGVGILVVVVFALLLVLGMNEGLPESAQRALVAFALFVTSVVYAAASIANNNLQDLKTGQLVDATPSKQQWALVVGVIAGALVIPPVLNLVNHAYGFLGTPGVNPAHALPAPQAGLISALAEGVIQHNVDWSAILIGGLIGAAVIVLDAALGRMFKTVRVPPLAVGLGIYLPTSSTLMIVVGSLVGWWFNRRADAKPHTEAIKQIGVLLASGLIVGESLLGVLFAAVVVASGRPEPIALVGKDFHAAAMWLGGVMFAVVVIVLYRWAGRLVRT